MKTKSCVAECGFTLGHAGGKRRPCDTSTRSQALIYGNFTALNFNFKGKKNHIRKLYILELSDTYRTEEE